MSRFLRQKTSQTLEFARFPITVRQRIRTPDLLVRSQTLYPAELRTHSYANRKKIFSSQRRISYHRRYIQSIIFVDYNLFMCYKYIVTFVTDNHCVFNETGDWSNGMIGVSKTFGGSSILSSPAKKPVEQIILRALTYFILYRLLHVFLQSTRIIHIYEQLFHKLVL